MTHIPAAITAELARLRAENARLLRLLKLSPQQAAPPGPAQAAYFEAPPGPVHDGSPPGAKVAFFGALYHPRPSPLIPGGPVLPIQAWCTGTRGDREGQPVHGTDVPRAFPGGRWSW